MHQTTTYNTTWSVLISVINAKEIFYWELLSTVETPLNLSQTDNLLSSLVFILWMTFNLFTGSLRMWSVDQLFPACRSLNNWRMQNVEITQELHHYQGTIEAIQKDYFLFQWLYGMVVFNHCSTTLSTRNWMLQNQSDRILVVWEEIGEEFRIYSAGQLLNVHWMPNLFGRFIF